MHHAFMFGRYLDGRRICLQAQAIDLGAPSLLPLPLAFFVRCLVWYTETWRLVLVRPVLAACMPAAPQRVSTMAPVLCAWCLVVQSLLGAPDYCNYVVCMPLLGGRRWSARDCGLPGRAVVPEHGSGTQVRCGNLRGDLLAGAPYT